jgi:hypothetical protein
LVIGSCLLAIGNLLQIAVLFYIERKERTITLLIWPAVFLLYLFPLTVNEILLRSEPGNLQILNQALAYSLVFNFAYLLGLVSATAFVPKTPKSSSPLFQSYYPKTALAAIGLTILLLAGNGLTLETALEGNWREIAGIGFSYVVLVWLFCFLCGQACGAHWHRQWLLFLLIVTFLLAEILLFRARIFILTLAVTYILYRIYYYPVSAKVLAMQAIAVFFAVSALRSLRFQGSLIDAVATGNFKAQFLEHLTSLFSDGDLAIYRVYLELVDGCGSHLSCFEFTNIRKATSLAGLVDPPETRLEYYLYDRLIEPGVGGSLHPTAYGIVYADFGITAGCLFIAVLAMLHVAATRIAHSGSFLVMAAFSAPYTVFFARGSIYNTVSILLVGILISLVFRIARKAPS